MKAEHDLVAARQILLPEGDYVEPEREEAEEAVRIAAVMKPAGFWRLILMMAIGKKMSLR